MGGGTVDAAAFRGQVLVVNLWYAGCVPCREEAPALAALARSDPQHVAVVGANTVDTEAGARRFMAEYDVPYPNVLDARDAPVRTALQRSITANATPTTVILDPDGRVAARILGAATSTQLSAAVAAAS